MASFGRFLIRTGFFLGETIAPGLAGRVALRLFSRTPDPKQVSKKEKRAIEHAGLYMGQARFRYLPMEEGGVIATYDFTSRNEGAQMGRALVVHGWRSRSEHLADVIDSLRQKGFGVVAIDLPGHGLSPGRRLDMAMAVRAVASVANRFGSFDLILGHSFGGAVVVNAVCGSIKGLAPVAAGRLILISAPSSMPALFERFAEFTGLGTRSRAALFAEIRRITGHPLEDFVGARQLASSGLPALVLHGSDDRVVPSREATAYGEAGSQVELYWAPGAGHRRILSDPAVLLRIGEFAAGKQHLALVG